MLNGRHALQALTYNIWPSFSSIGGFLDLLMKSAPASFKDKSEIKAFLVDYLHQNHDYIKDADKRLAINFLLKRDIPLIIDQIDLLQSGQLEKSLNIIQSTKTHVGDAIAYCQRISLIENEPKLFFVDELPKPFNKRPHFAISTDQGDYINYGITPGIYFLNSLLRPIYSPYLAFHELAHSIIGLRTPDVLACGIEEGLAEFFGAIFLTSEIFGIDKAEKLFVYNRYFGSNSKHWNTYVENTKMLVPFFNKFGWNGIFTLVNEGRGLIKKVENTIFHSTDIDFKATSYFGEKENFLYKESINRLLCVYNGIYVCSPIARYVAAHCEQGITLIELANITGLSKESLLVALAELENEFGLITMKSDKSIVSFSDCKNMDSHPLRLRYDSTALF